jgi:hypothetical protein
MNHKILLILVWLILGVIGLGIVAISLLTREMSQLRAQIKATQIELKYAQDRISDLTSQDQVRRVVRRRPNPAGWVTIPQ